MRFRVLLFLALFGCSLSAPAQGPLDRHLEAIDWARYQDTAVKLLQEYLRIDTSNPPGNEYAAAQFFHRIFDEAGIANTIFPYAPGRADFYAVLKGDGSMRPLVLMSHMDVVRADPTSWRAPPFSGQIIDGEMYARGALDMKDEGLLHAMVMLIAAREHLPLKRDLIFLATSDEEVGGTGSEWFLENHPELVRGAQYLITEGGSNLIDRGTTVYGIGVAEKAPFWIRVTARARGGHGSIPIPDSAPDLLVQALARIVAWQPPIRLLPSVVEYFRQIAPLEKGQRASQFRDIGKALRDPTFAQSLALDENSNYLLRDTVSLTVLRGGPQTNVIPDTASAELDVRLLPGEDPQAFLAELRKVVHDDRIELEAIGRFKAPNSSSIDTSLYHAIEQVVRKYNPRALVAPSLNSGYTESQMYRPLGITCYGFNPVEITPELDESEHAANERIPVEQVRRSVKVLYEVVARVATEGANSESEEPESRAQNR